MPTTHIWKTNASAFISDPTDYTDGTTFMPGDTLVFSSGTPDAGNGTLITGAYQANTTGASIGLYFLNILTNSNTALSVAGPLTLQWEGDGTFMNGGTLSLGTPSSPGTVHYSLYDHKGSDGSFTNDGTMTLQNGSSFNFDQGLSGNGNFVNAAGALLSIGSGSTFSGPGTLNTKSRPIFENDGRVEVDGAVGRVTTFKPPATYGGSGVLAIHGADGDAAKDAVAVLSGNVTGRMDLSSGTLIFNSDYNTGPSVTINFLDTNGLVYNSNSEIGGSISSVQTGHPLQATINGFVAGDVILYKIYYPFLLSPPPVITAYDPASHVLTLTLNAGQVSHLTFNGNYTLSDFKVVQNYDTFTLTTTSTANALSAPPPQAVAFTPGNDSLTDAPGNQAYTGDGGHDVLTINEGRRGDVFSLLAGGTVSVAHAGQLDTVLGISDITFIDGRMVFDPSDPAASVTRLYNAALGRAPDQAGLHQWVGALQHGGALVDLATAFAGSAEFTARFGAGLSNPDFVTRMYQNALGRQPDAAGLAGWTSQLNASQVTRGQVLVAFSECPENRALTQAQVAGGIWDVSETASEVARLYDTTLGRLPDAAGLAGWTTALNTGATLASVAAGFVASAEFQATYGALSNAAFVSALYGNTLHRAADAAGAAGWTATLNAGTSRAQVVVGFSESAEHQQNTAANIMSNNPTQYGIKLTS